MATDEWYNYGEPCTREKNSSLESVWLDPSEFGECYPPASDTQIYPCLSAVYNGADLKIHPELIHAGLSGISMKHYYGKCCKEKEEEEEEEEENVFGIYEPAELYGYDLFDLPSSMTSSSLKSLRVTGGGDESPEAQSFEYKESVEDPNVVRPMCVQPRINFRNSFWNLHRPELCKLTWPQNYVSTATVIEHLHEHLTRHGPLCEDYHSVESRIKLLNKELDQYVCLKILAQPRELPPDEPLFSFKMEEQKEIPKCEGKPIILRKKVPMQSTERFLSLSDEEVDNETKGIHRSNEEFCLTIGKHVRKPPMTTTVIPVEKGYFSPEQCFAAEEGEENLYYYFNWLGFEGEECNYPEAVGSSMSEREMNSEGGSEAPCPPLAMDDFCRSIAKADFSDLRCNPDDF